MHTRSTSPYEDRSCSESVGCEHSVASSSPHIPTVPDSFESPQSHYTQTATQPWIPPAIVSTEQSFLYTYPHLAANQRSTAYDMGALPTTNSPVWSTIPSTASTGYSTPDPTYQTLYPSHASLWPSSDYGAFYPGSVHHYKDELLTASYSTLWHHGTSDESLSGIVINPYERRYYTYDPSSNPV